MAERIAILGAGQVGGTLGRAWAEKGHSIRFGVPNPADPKYRALIDAAAGDVGVATVPAAASADIAVLATPWPATRNAIEAAGDLRGKLVIDCTNPLRMGPAGLELAVGHATSGGEQVAGWAPGAQVCKALNQVGFDIMADPAFPAGRAK